jgi:hypothetical protein
MSFGEAEFGYYREFYVAQHALQQSDCAEIIEFNYVNKDVVLEGFTFQVTTKSGHIIRLYFDVSYMDVYQVCHAPRGLSVDDKVTGQSQLYTIAGLSELLKGQGIQIKDLNDILCHLNELEPLFRTHNSYATETFKSDPYAWDYLHIRFPDETWHDVNDFFDIRKHNVRELP